MLDSGCSVGVDVGDDVVECVGDTVLIGSGCEGGISVETGDNGVDVDTTGGSGVPCDNVGYSVPPKGTSVHCVRVRLCVACTGVVDARISTGVGSCVAAIGIGVHDAGESVFNSGALVRLGVGTGVRCTDEIGVDGTGAGVDGIGVGVGGAVVGGGGTGVGVGGTGVGVHGTGVGVGDTGVVVGGTGVGVGGTGDGVGGTGVGVVDNGVGDQVGACVGAVVIGAAVGAEDGFGTGDCPAGFADSTFPGVGVAVTKGAELGEEGASAGDGVLTGFVESAKRRS